MTQTTTPDNGLHQIGLAPFVNRTGVTPPGGESLSKLKRTYTTAEFAAELGVSTKKVTSWIRTRKLRVIPDCRPYLLPASELVRMENGVLV
jgi:hypothetical protein